MSDPEPLPQARPQPPRQEAGRGRDVMLSLLSAGLFLYVGFFLGLEGVSGDPVYDGSVAVLTWGARLVGIGILATIGMTYLHVPGVAAVDFLLALLATLLCACVGAVWLAYGDGQGLLLLLFALLNGSATRAAWTRWRFRAALRAPADDEYDQRL